MSANIIVITPIHLLARCSNLTLGIAFGDRTGQAHPNYDNDSHDKSYNPDGDDSDHDDDDANIAGVYDNENKNKNENNNEEITDNANEERAANYHEANKITNKQGLGLNNQPNIDEDVIIIYDDNKDEPPEPQNEDEPITMDKDAEEIEDNITQEMDKNMVHTQDNITCDQDGLEIMLPLRAS
jgi:hypothetical protein